MASEGARNGTDPEVVVALHPMLTEISRLCGVNGITPANQVAAINSLTDAQIAGFVRRLLITGVILLP